MFNSYCICYVCMCVGLYYTVIMYHVYSKWFHYCGGGVYLKVFILLYSVKRVHSRHSEITPYSHYIFNYNKTKWLINYSNVHSRQIINFSDGFIRN